MDRRQRVTFRFVIMISSVLMLMCTSSSDSDKDKDKDKEECTEQLVGLATCLPYVGNTAKSPTPDCCNGLRNVLKTNKKCLCVIVKDRNDPDLGLTINATLALGLPSVCHAPANVSNCPALLHLAPNSPEAQIFYQFDHGSNSTATSTPSSPISSGKVNTTSSGMSAPKDGNGINKRWVNWEIIVGGGLMLWSFT